MATTLPRRRFHAVRAGSGPGRPRSGTYTKAELGNLSGILSAKKRNAKATLESQDRQKQRSALPLCGLWGRRVVGIRRAPACTHAPHPRACASRNETLLLGTRLGGRADWVGRGPSPRGAGSQRPGRGASTTAAHHLDRSSQPGSPKARARLAGADGTARRPSKTANPGPAQMEWGALNDILRASARVAPILCGASAGPAATIRMITGPEERQPFGGRQPHHLDQADQPIPRPGIYKTSLRASPGQAGGRACFKSAADADAPKPGGALRATGSTGGGKKAVQAARLFHFTGQWLANTRGNPSAANSPG